FVASCTTRARIRRERARSTRTRASERRCTRRPPTRKRIEGSEGASVSCHPECCSYRTSGPSLSAQPTPALWSARCVEHGQIELTQACRVGENVDLDDSSSRYRHA